eukprot:2020220-Amphidinium_carterae.1
MHYRRVWDLSAVHYGRVRDLSAVRPSCLRGRKLRISSTIDIVWSSLNFNVLDQSAQDLYHVHL